MKNAHRYLQIQENLVTHFVVGGMVSMAVLFANTLSAPAVYFMGLALCLVAGAFFSGRHSGDQGWIVQLLRTLTLVLSLLWGTGLGLYALNRLNNMGWPQHDLSLVVSSIFVLGVILTLTLPTQPEQPDTA